MSVKESGSGNTDHRIRPVARIHTDFPTKFGIPRQSGLTGELESRIVFEPEFSNPDAVRGIEEFSHLWLIWEFSENVRDPKKWSPTVLADGGSILYLQLCEADNINKKCFPGDPLCDRLPVRYICTDLPFHAAHP